MLRLIFISLFLLFSHFGWSIPQSNDWKTGDIVITRHQFHPYSLVIQLATQSNVEHVGLVSVEDQVYIYEFWAGKFRKTPMEQFQKRMGKFEGDTFVGKGHITAVSQLPENKLRHLRQYLSLAVKTQDTSRFVPSCSQYLADALKDVGIRFSKRFSIENPLQDPLVKMLAQALSLDIETLQSAISPLDFFTNEKVKNVKLAIPLVSSREEVLKRWSKKLNWTFFSHFLSKDHLRFLEAVLKEYEKETPNNSCSTLIRAS